VDLERGPLSLVSTIEELLERKSVGSHERYCAVRYGALTCMGRIPSMFRVDEQAESCVSLTFPWTLHSWKGCSLVVRHNVLHLHTADFLGTLLCIVLGDVYYAK
jgi:hypothetical protein